MNTTKVFSLKFALSIYVLCLVILNPTYATAQLDKRGNQTNDYLAKPTGEYRVGFDDFYWINDNLCPDPNYNGKNDKDFSKGNTRKCHEIMARIYYPTLVKDTANNRSQYYKPAINTLQDMIKAVPGVNSKQVQELSNIKGYTIKNAPIIADKQFPVIIFSPGFGTNAQQYENIITELVSQGYIVIGVNTLFINGTVTMPDDRMVKSAIPSSTDEVLKKFTPIQVNDVLYIYTQIKKLHNSNKIFSGINLNQIGLLGHSIGAGAIAEVAGMHPSWLKAVATLDVPPFPLGIKKITVPFMQMLNSNYKTFRSWPIAGFNFEDNKSYIVVTLSPSIEDTNYTQHLSYSDLSTMQYIPVFQSGLKYMNQQQPEINIKFMSSKPINTEYKDVKKSTFVIVKKQSGWNIFIYFPNHESFLLSSINLIKGLEPALNNLPEQDLEKLTEQEILPINKILQQFVANASTFGDGDGWEVTNSINTYVVQFFDTFLKKKKSKQLVKCEILSPNTMIACGTQK